MINRQKLIVVALLTSALSINCLMAEAKTSSRRYREPPAYMPTGLDDPRLAEDTFYAKGTEKYQEGIKDRYSDELYRYAKKLFKEKKYAKALQVIDLSLKSQSKPSLDAAEDLRIRILLTYADSLGKPKGRPYYEEIVIACDNGLKGWHALDYYLPKVDALIGLGRTEDAIRCCEIGYNAAQGESRDVSVYAATLAKLNGHSKPANNLIAATPASNKANLPDTTSTANNLTKDNILRIQKEVAEMVKHETCPTQKEIETIVGDKFEVQFPDQPNLIRRGIPKGNVLYKHVDLNIPHKLDGPSSLILTLRPEAAAITQEMVRSWFGKLEPIREQYPLVSSLTYEYPWGEVDFAFSPFYSKAADSITYRWAKSSECDGLVDPFEGPQPSVEDKLKDIDDWYSKGEKKWAFKMLYWKIANLVPGVSTTEARQRREAVRERLIKWKENEMKPEIVAYLKVAPYKELAESMRQIIFCTRADFFTLKEYKKFPYQLVGEIDESLNGHCWVEGLKDCRIIAIEEKTDAARRFFNLYKVKLPFKVYVDNPIYISPLNGPLIDQIEEEQEALVEQRVKERTEIEKAKYIEDSKNPEIVKQRVIDARRAALDPRGAALRQAFRELYKRQK
jgi:hypothetical protein